MKHVNEKYFSGVTTREEKGIRKKKISLVLRRVEKGEDIYRDIIVNRKLRTSIVFDPAVLFVNPYLQMKVLERYAR